MSDSEGIDRFRRSHPATVSVVIPIRNGADLLPIQLEALARQQYEHDWEIIVVDNGSTDGSAEVARSWADRLPVQVVSANDKPGVSYARNVGISAARGELIAFCDADDEVTDGWLRALIETSLESDAAGGSLEASRLSDPVAVLWRESPMTEGLMLQDGFLPAASTNNLCVWADVLRALNGFNEEYAYGAPDIEFCWRLQLAGYRLAFSRQALVHYRLRQDLRGLSRQSYLYGQADCRLYRDFRSVGMRRSSIRGSLRTWAWLIVHVPDLARDRSRQGVWVRVAAKRMGRVVGSVKYRAAYP